MTEERHRAEPRFQQPPRRRWLASRRERRRQQLLCALATTERPLERSPGPPTWLKALNGERQQQSLCGDRLPRSRRAACIFESPMIGISSSSNFLHTSPWMWSMTAIDSPHVFTDHHPVRRQPLGQGMQPPPRPPTASSWGADHLVDVARHPVASRRARILPRSEMNLRSAMLRRFWSVEDGSAEVTGLRLGVQWQRLERLGVEVDDLPSALDAAADDDRGRPARDFGLRVPGC